MILTNLSQYTLRDAVERWYRVNQYIPNQGHLLPSEAAPQITAYLTEEIRDLTGTQTLDEMRVIERLIIECLVQDNLTLTATVKRVARLLKETREKQRQLAALSR